LTSFIIFRSNGFPRPTKVTTQTPLKSDFLAEVEGIINVEA